MNAENGGIDEIERCEDCGEPLATSSFPCTNCGWRPDGQDLGPECSEPVAPSGLLPRLLAGMVDWVLVSVLSYGVYLVVYIALFYTNTHGHNHEQQDARALLSIGVIAWVVPWLYFASFESSSLQGAIGKSFLGLRVTDRAGRRIGFLQASRRHLAKFTTLVLGCVGLLPILFTERKQAVHDLLAGTEVVR